MLKLAQFLSSYRHLYLILQDFCIQNYTIFEESPFFTSPFPNIRLYISLKSVILIKTSQKSKSIDLIILFASNSYNEYAKLILVIEVRKAISSGVKEYFELERDMEKSSRRINMFYTLMWILVTMVCTYVKTHSVSYIQLRMCIVLYVNSTSKQKHFYF